MLHRPVFRLRLRNAQYGLEHLLLVDEERRGIDVLIGVVLQARTGTFGLDRQTEKPSDCPSDLWPCRGVDASLAVVEEGSRTLLYVDAVR